ncbi:MAG: pitrilysin family protein [Gammaproteobacteria bacterium]
MFGDGVATNPVRRRCSSWAAALLLWLLPAVGWAMAPIQHWQTANGARVYFVPAPELPMVDVRVVFDAGSARDNGHPGLAHLTNALLDQGAGELTADQIADRLAGLGAQLSTGAMRDMAWVSLRSLSAADRLNPAADLVAKVLTQPTFKKAAFDREQQRLIVAARQREQQPAAVAEQAFYRDLYGNQPYGSPPGGTVDSLQGLNSEDARGFYLRYYVAHNATVAIVGALDSKQAHALAERLVGKLPAGEAPDPLPKVSDLSRGKTQRVDFPASQTTIMMGAPGISRTDPDYFPLYVGNYVLGGGGLVSRLNEQIREKRGLSYSVYSYFAPMARRGPFVLGLQTRNDKASEALGLMKKVLDRYVKNGPTAKEVEAAKKNITGGFPLRVDTNAKIVEYLAMIGYYHLPLDYLKTFNRKVQAVTRKQIHAAFERRVHPDRMVTVVVGGGQ